MQPSGLLPGSCCCIAHTNTLLLSCFQAGPLADLSITKSAPASIKEGVPFNYVLTINNAGPDAATSVNVRDALPGSVSAIGSATVTPAAGEWQLSVSSVAATAPKDRKC